MPTYYVSNAGSDSNNGTSTSTPFLTIAHAESVAVNGTTINLLGTSTFPETNTFTDLEGLTIQSYGTGQ
jgi:hypothetical protein